MFALPDRNDRKTYRTIYRKYGRILLPGLLEAAAAETLARALSDTIEWNTVVNSGNKLYELTPETFASLSDEEAASLRTHVINAARIGYQFEFDNHRMSENGEPYKDPTATIAPIVTHLNSFEFLSFARELTGVDDIEFADAQATRYRPGHFLHVHDDIDTAKKRRLAYVLNLTSGWRPEWGGILNFLDSDGHVSEGYTPGYNAMVIFAVGVPHFVSYVAPFASVPRLSITGWLRAR